MVNQGGLMATATWAECSFWDTRSPQAMLLMVAVHGWLDADGMLLSHKSSSFRHRPAVLSRSRLSATKGCCEDKAREADFLYFSLKIMLSGENVQKLQEQEALAC